MLQADVSEIGSGWSDERIAEALETSLSAVLRTRRQFVEEGLDSALSRKKSSWSPPWTFDGEAEAKLIALTCSEPPKGHTHWTLRLLEKCVVKLGIVEAASDTTIYRVLKNTKLNRIKKYWVIPSEVSAGFVATMEDTLKVYTRPHDPARPLVFLEETSKQLTRVTRPPLPHGPGREARIDYEYERAGVANLFMHFAPLVLSYILLAGKDAKVWFWRSWVVNCHLHPEPTLFRVVSHASISSASSVWSGMRRAAFSKEYAEFAFGHIEPRPMFWGGVHLDAFRDAEGLGRWECLVQ